MTAAAGIGSFSRERVCIQLPKRCHWVVRMQPIPSRPASSASVAGVARARKRWSEAVTFGQDRQRALRMLPGIGGAGEERADEAADGRSIGGVRAEALCVGDEYELVVRRDSYAVERDDRRLEPAFLKLDAFDVAVDADHGVDPVREQRGQQVVADGHHVHVLAREACGGECRVECRVVPRGRR